MIVLFNYAANLAQKEDAVTKYACLTQSESEAQLGLPLSVKENHRRLWRENLSTAEIGGLVANSKQPKQIVYSV